MEHDLHLARAKVPQGRRVARDTLLHRAASRAPQRAEARAPLPDAQRQPVTCAMLGVMAGRTSDVAVARQDRVVEQQLAHRRRLWIDRMKVPRPQRHLRVCG